jgi:hypothetical protein
MHGATIKRTIKMLSLSSILQKFVQNTGAHVEIFNKW